MKVEAFLGIAPPLRNASLQTAYVAVLCVTLFACGLWHLLQGSVTERLFSKRRNVRAVGALLLLGALPCFVFRGWYFLCVGVLLAVSGAMRLVATDFNVRLQQAAYPRWVHGWVMVAGACLAWVSYPGP